MCISNSGQQEHWEVVHMPVLHEGHRAGLYRKSRAILNEYDVSQIAQMIIPKTSKRRSDDKNHPARDRC